MWGYKKQTNALSSDVRIISYRKRKWNVHVFVVLLTRYSVFVMESFSDRHVLEDFPVQDS